MVSGRRQEVEAANIKPTSGVVEKAWTLMQRFVGAHNRHGELADALGFRLVAKRGKVLFQLCHRAQTLTQLAEANRMDAPYTTLIVDKLESHGLVERQPDPDDRRRKLVSLTKAGHEAIATADVLLQRPPRAVGTLSDKQLRQLIVLLEQFIEVDRSTGSGPCPQRRSAG